MMEEILSKLLVADNAVIQQGTQELREAFKNPEVIPALCNVIGQSQNPQIRQYAAVLLRKRLTKSKHWTKLPADVRAGIKQGILQAMVNEPEKFVKNSIAQFIGTILKHELPNQNWPEVLQFIQQLTESDNLSDKELGMYTLSVITDISVGQFLPHVGSMAFLFSNMLNSVQDLSSPLAYYTVITMIHFVPLAGDQGLMNTFHQLMPRVMQVVRALSVTDEEKASEVMELFDDLVENCVVVIVPHAKALVEMCLEFALNKQLGETIRVKALIFIGWLAQSKKKTILKNKLIQPIIDVLFQLMSTPPENEELEEYFSENIDANTPMTSATQTLDILALHLPPDQIFPPLMTHVAAGLNGTNPYATKAAHLAMAVIVEGCSEYIRTKHLPLLLECICRDITNPATVVRNASLFALGQFSEHLQPDISKYAAHILPVLFDCLGKLCNQLSEKGKEPPSLDRMFYALEMFSENLGDELLPYLPMLMETLFTALNPNNSVHVRELALSCIGAIANSAKEGIVPYFPRIIECLKVYLTSQEQDDGTVCLRIQAVDTLGVLARNLGEEHFLPIAQETVTLGLGLMLNTDEPDLKKSCFGLFGALSCVLKTEMRSVVPTLVEIMLDALRSTDGIVPHYKDEENSAFPVYEDLSDEADEEDIENESEESDDDDLAGYSVENAYVLEKEEACLALTELAKNTGECFLPHLEKCFEEVFKVVNYPQDEIRKAAVEALVQFSLNFNQIKTAEGRTALKKALSMVIPKCAELIRADEERGVVMGALDAYSELLKELKEVALEGEGHRDAIINCITDVMTYKTECQDTDQEGAEDPEAEQDEMLIEYAGDIIPALGKAMTPDEFAQYFELLLPHLECRTKKKCTVSQRSFSIGTVSEALEPLGPRIGQFLPQLLPLFLLLSKDESGEVRNNAIFGLGELVLHGKEAVFPHYPEILQTLFAAASKETHTGTLDNICGALARLILSNVNAVPMDQVFPVFVNYLPLREDFDENKAVFECLTHLYQIGHPLLLSHVAQIMKAGLVVLCEKQGIKATMDLVLNLMKNMRNSFSKEFSNVVASIPQEYTPIIQELFS